MRSELLTARRALTGAALERAAAATASRLVDLLRAGRPSVVVAYAPVGSEPGGAGLPELLAGTLAEVAGGGTLLLPVLLPDLDLDWAAYQGPHAMTRPAAGPPSLREPSGPRLGVAAVTGARLVIVPALAVDRHGVRMGRGGGSYDRALARVAPSALVVALLHDGELVERVPAEPHDRPVDAALLPSGMIHFGAGDRRR